MYSHVYNLGVNITQYNDEQWAQQCSSISFTENEVFSISLIHSHCDAVTPFHHFILSASALPPV